LASEDLKEEELVLLAGIGAEQVMSSELRVPVVIKHLLHGRSPFFVIFHGNMEYWLVVSNIFYFPFHIWDVILPLTFIFFKMVKTTNQNIV
jgi:hypothetical protein